MNKIPICLSADEKYSMYCAVNIASICDNTMSDCMFYILDGGIPQTNKLKIKSLETKYKNCQIEFIPVDDTPVSNLYVRSYLSVATYYRFLIPQILTHLKKCIYLDCDIVTLGDIKELYDEDLSGYAIGAVQDIIDQEVKENPKERLSLDINSIYFNAGVLLMDLEQLRPKIVFDSFLKIEKQYRNRLKCCDQDILNIYYNKNFKIIDKKYNAMAPRSDSIIRHFIGELKPWISNFYIYNDKLTKLGDVDKFWYYAKKTPFYDTLKEEYENFTNAHLVFKQLNKKFAN